VSAAPLSHPVPDAAALAARVAVHRPRILGLHWAATALVLTDTAEGPAVLVIRRLAREGDRWSGDMALPGGKRDPGDVDVVHTAARETWEETRVRVGDPVGRLDDLDSRGSGQRIATVVFTVEGRPDPVPEPAEVADALWLPVAALADEANRTWHRYRGVVHFPSITVGEHMIWGLTHRILTHFMSVAGIT
jgi:8-oxo-dGTP pyrophosphatase MutT (NUDIX family)